MNLLTDESPQVYHPTLATWVGLNEAIFLAQLHYILTKNESVGKFTDGRKWYRDKPHDFVVKYFPFWDEGIVKRVLDNLRADGLLMARSDLNKDPKDRSLWYTIHYEAVERLTGPVERITAKSEKRKEARKARKPKEDNQTDYTKVQNVLLQNNPTKCTSDLGTKCTDEKVQIVPTPKESFSKTPLPKETTPNGVAAKPQPGDGPKTKIKDRFLELTHLEMPNLKKDKGYWWSRFGEILHLARGDPDLACTWQTEAVGYMQTNNLTITGPQSILGMIRALASGQALHKNGANNGHHTKSTKPAALTTADDQARYQRMAALLPADDP